MTLPDTGNFRNLLQAMSAGSEEAAWELVETYTPHVIRAIRATLPQAIRSKVDSQDFVQLVWASILLRDDRLRQFEKPEQFIGYLAAMARHKVIDENRRYHSRKKNVRHELHISTLQQGTRSNSSENRQTYQVPSIDPSPSQIALARDSWDRLLMRSSERDQEIAKLRLAGLPYFEIAERLCISEKTVQRTLSRLLESIGHE